MYDKTLEFNNNFINQIIYHSTYETEFLQKIRHRISIDTYKKEEKKFLMQLIYDFFDDYKTAPRDNLIDIVTEQEKKIDEKLYAKIINYFGVLNDITGSNWEYILNKINDALKYFMYKDASIDFAKLIKHGKMDEAKRLMLETVGSSAIEDKYSHYSYFEDQTYIRERMETSQYLMQTNIKELDRIIGGLQRKWLVTFLGTTKFGKSWFLMEMAAQAVLQGLNVLFISLEMGKKIIDQRFDMIFGFMSSKNGDPNEEIERMRYNKETGLWSAHKEMVKDTPSIYDIEYVKKIRKQAKGISKGNLIVQAFNRGRLNYRDVDTKLMELELYNNFIADLVIIDYLGIMAQTESNQKKKDKITENSLGLIEIASERDLLMITGMQGNRKAMTAKVFKSDLVADDIDTIWNSDLVLAGCQTEKEEEHNRYRLFVANFRHGPQHDTVEVIRDLMIGQIALDSRRYVKLELDEEDDDLMLESGVSV